MNIRLKFVVVFLLGSFLALPTTLAGAASTEFPPITVSGDKLFAGDEELLLVAIGYSPYRPGQILGGPVAHPEFGFSLIEEDMRRIKAAGFNAIRTWNLNDEKLLAAAAANGLWVIGGIWTSPSIELIDEAKIAAQERIVDEQAAVYGRFPNTAMLLLLNEPPPHPILHADRAKLAAYFERLVAAAHRHCPKVPASFSNWPNSSFIDMAPFDAVSYNLYRRMPAFSGSVEFSGYLDGMIKRFGAGKPFLVSEFAYYSVPKERLAEDRFSYNNAADEADQGRLMVEDMDTVYQRPIAGAALMTWGDQWNLASSYTSPGMTRPEGWNDAQTHDPDAIEWAGLVAYDEDPHGVARPALAAVTAANQAIAVDPDEGAIYTGGIPVNLWVNESVASVEISVDGNTVQKAQRASPHWIRARLEMKGIEPGVHALRLTALDQDGKPVRVIERRVRTAATEARPQLSITSEKDAANATWFLFTVLDAQGQPLAGAQVRWGIFDMINWKETGGSLTTDEAGTARLKRSVPSAVQLIGGAYSPSDGSAPPATDLFLYKI